MASIHLIEGPVGAGKSTFAARLGAELGAPHLNLDEWFSILFSPDRPESGVMAWYAERKWRCVEQIWRVARALGEGGQDAILELGLLTREERQAFYARVAAAGLGLKVYVLDAPRALRRERVRRRNAERGPTYRMVVPDAIFELASDRWEPPDEAEQDGRVILWVRGGR